MKIRFNLYLQTLGMLVLYLAVLLSIVLFCFNTQFGVGWEAAMQSPLGERFETIAGAISTQLHSSKPASWQEIIQTFEEIYHVDFYVFDITGTELAGKTITLPEAVASRISPMPPEMRFHGPFGGPQPPPGEHFPPDGPHFGPGPGPDFGGPPPMPPEFKNGGPMPPMPFMGRHHQPPPAFFMHSHGRFIVHTANPDKFWICARIHVESPKLGFAVPALLIAGCDNLWQTSLLFDFKFAAKVFAAVMALSLIFWWPFIYRITTALSRLTAATESIAQGKFDTRVKAGGSDEIGRLSEAVDVMAERLEGYVQDQKRLLADISHELFSPLARLQLALELLESSATDEQQSQVNDIREEVSEMNNLVSELIAYSKAGMQAKTPELSKVNLKTLVDNLLPRLIDGGNVQSDLPQHLNVLADPLLLDRAVSNILRNSIRYAGSSGPITISAAANGDRVTLSIVDYGPGVSEDALKHLGEPFYRPEASRNRSSGGFGLGLAIVKSCVEACQGTLAVRNTLPAGLTVELFLQSA